MVVDGEGQLDQQRCSEDFLETLCLSQFQLGRSSQATSQKVFLNERILATQAMFCIIPCPRGKKFCLVNGRHQPDLFCSFAQEIPSIGLYKELPMDFELVFDRSKQCNCIIDYFMQSASQLIKTFLLMEDIRILLSFSLVKTYFIWERNAESSI